MLDELQSNDFIYNTDETYVSSIQYDDLSLDTMVFSGFRVAGTGLIISLLVLGLLSILRKA